MTTLVTFNDTNGNRPYGSLTRDAAGNLYGTTQTGGASHDGTVFELSGTNHQTLTTLATFNTTNGAFPYAGLTADNAGNLYGTTYRGGTNQDGTVFELSGTNHQTLTTLVMFNITNNSNGLEPWGGLMFDDAGNLYGTTSSGGYAEDGTVFELSGTNYQTLTTLATFNTGNGSSPQAVLTADAAGNLYGTTTEGGVAYGTIFELTGTGFVVPEPGSLSLLAIGGLGLLNRRRRIA